MLTTMTYAQFKDELEAQEWHNLYATYSAKYSQLKDSRLCGDFITDYETSFETQDHGFASDTMALFDEYYRARYSSDDRQALLRSLYPEFAAQVDAEKAKAKAEAKVARRSAFKTDMDACVATNKAIAVAKATKAVKQAITYAWAFIVKLGKKAVCEMLGIASDVKTNYMSLCSKLYKKVNNLP